MSVLIFLAILVAVGALAYVAYRAKQRRREELALFAFQHGMQFSHDDPYDLTSHDFRLFQLGDGRGCENVMAGTWQDLPVKEADYWYYTESSDSKGQRTRTYHRFSVVLAEMGCTLPHVSVEKENVLSWVAGHLGFHDIEFESEEFNRMFTVKAKDQQFAFELLDARMIKWLQSTGGQFGFEVSGQGLLVWSGRRRAGELVPLFGCATMFCDHIPRLVWNQYGTIRARPDGPGEAGGRSSS